jgi:hypothetical protein
MRVTPRFAAAPIVTTPVLVRHPDYRRVRAINQFFDEKPCRVFFLRRLAR